MSSTNNKDVIVSTFDIKGKAIYQTYMGREGDGYKVRIYYNSDGTVDEKATYEEWYIKEVLHPTDDAPQKGKKKKHSSKKESCIKRILLAPFRLIKWLLWDFLVVGILWKMIVRPILALLGITFLIGLFTGDYDD